MVPPPQIAIGELSRVYLYGAQVGNVPEEEPESGTRPGAAAGDPRGPSTSGHRAIVVRLLVILIPVPLDRVTPDTRDPPALECPGVLGGT